MPGIDARLSQEKEIDDQEQAGDRDLIFGRGPGGYTGWSKPKERLDARIKEANAGKAIAAWRIHDLRRTFATYASGGLPADQLGRLSAREQELAHGLGILPHVIEAVLNHSSGSKSGVAGVYNKSTYEKEKRAALNDWAERLDLIARTDAENVTPLRRAKA